MLIPLFIIIDLVFVREYVLAFELIRPFNNIVEGRIVGAYHLAKIIPPARYRVIIWDKLFSNRRISRADTNVQFNCNTVFFQNSQLFSDVSLLQNSVEDLAKCFANFYTVQTDEKGRFLLLVNGKMPSDYLPLKRNYKFTILPLNHNNLDSIINEHSFSKDLVQEFYDLNMNDPVDTICQFCEKRCFINYFESLQKRETVLNDLIDNWLSRIGNYEEFLNKENFFLLANFRDLIDKAKQHEIAATKMPSWEARFLGMFWNSFSRTRKTGLLWKRLRLVDQRIAELIDEFCEIDVDFLKWHTKVSAEISKSNLPEKFCSFWPATKEKATKLLHKEMALNAFSQWLNTSEQLNNEEEQIIQFWIDVFAKRLASCNFKWPELDNDLFVEIGMLFANVREQECLTLDKIERVKGTRKNLDTICKKIDQINRYQFNVPDSWNVELCANSKFQHVITHIITNRGEKRRLSDIIGSNSTKCVMCMEKEVKIMHYKKKCLINKRETAFDPCGHLFTCNKCSKNLTKCPICDMKIEAKLTIYKP